MRMRLASGGSGGGQGRIVGPRAPDGHRQNWSKIHKSIMGFPAQDR
jgi:hypothetical protein